MENKWNEIVKHSTQKPNDNATNWEKFSRIFPSPPWKAKRRKRKGVSQLVLCGVFALIFVNGTWTNFQWAHLTGRWQDGWVSEWEWKWMHWRTANHPIRHSGIRSFIWSFTRRVIHAVKQSKVSIKTAMCQVPRLDSTLLFYYIWFKHFRYRHMRTFPHTPRRITLAFLLFPLSNWNARNVRELKQMSRPQGGHWSRYR